MTAEEISQLEGLLSSAWLGEMGKKKTPASVLPPHFAKLLVFNGTRKFQSFLMKILLSFPSVFCCPATSQSIARSGCVFPDVLSVTVP